MKKMTSFMALPARVREQIRFDGVLPYVEIDYPALAQYGGCGCGWLEFDPATGKHRRLRYALRLADNGTSEQNIDTAERAPGGFWAAGDAPAPITDIPGAHIWRSDGVLRMFVNFSCRHACLDGLTDAPKCTGARLRRGGDGAA